MKHRACSAIVAAIDDRSLEGLFSAAAFESACSGLGAGTYHASLDKHVEGNGSGNSELFQRVSPGLFRCLRPLKCGPSMIHECSPWR